MKSHEFTKGLSTIQTVGGCFFWISEASNARWWRFQTFFYVHPYLGKMIQFDDHIFSDGWFNHQEERYGMCGSHVEVNLAILPTVPGFPHD